MCLTGRLFMCLVLFCGCGSMCGAYNWNDNPGNGTAENPYQISTAEQVASIGSNAVLLDDHFILTNDINMSAYTFTNSPIAPDTDQSSNVSTGENKFSGSLNGNGYRIWNLTIIRSGAGYNIGLVGLTTSLWQIRNLGLENVNITLGNLSDSFGAMVGRAYGGVISGCYTTGSVTGGDACKYMRGLAGFASAANISNCYNECAVSNGAGCLYTGGAVGYLVASTGRLEKSFSIGVVDSGSTSPTIGALVGTTLTGAQVNDCYYLTGVGPDNGIGMKRSVTELVQRSTYVNWEFVDSTPGYWRMRSDVPDFPYLSWEFIAADFYADFQIDGRDFAEFSQTWQRGQFDIGYNWLCDLNENNIIDLGDLQIFCDDWLTPYETPMKP